MEIQKENPKSFLISKKFGRGISKKQKSKQENFNASPHQKKRKKTMKKNKKMKITKTEESCLNAAQVWERELESQFLEDNEKYKKEEEKCIKNVIEEISKKAEEGRILLKRVFEFQKQ